MFNKHPKLIKYRKLLIKTVGFGLLPLIWFLLKSLIKVPDRYLPSFSGVFNAAFDIEPNILWHIAYTVSRFAFGFALGIVAGVLIGLMIAKYSWLFDLFMPSIQTTRAVPALAIIPFFLVWFGFSELGRYILVIVGTSFNIAVATFQIIKTVPEKYKIMFKSFGLRPEDLILKYGLPRVAEQILPTLRFSLSTAIGLIIISELLGAQVGLGYLIQTSKSNYAMQTVFLATIFLGLVNVFSDWSLKFAWSKLIYWRQS